MDVDGSGTSGLPQQLVDGIAGIRSTARGRGVGAMIALCSLVHFCLFAQKTLAALLGICRCMPAAIPSTKGWEKTMIHDQGYGEVLLL